MKPLLALLLIVFAARAQVRIGAESVLGQLPSSATHLLQIGFQPDDGSVQTLNPPLFTWIYAPDPFNVEESTPRVFQFQLTTNRSGANPDWSSLYWNVTTSNNLYNTLPAVTNASGAIFGGTSWWRVIYYPSNGTAAASVSTSAVHHFTISASATNWNRSMLADTNYLHGQLNDHPHLFFWATNRDAVATTARNYVQGGQNWAGITNYSVTIVTNEWWTNNFVLTNVLNGVTNPVSPEYRAYDLMNVALTAQIQTNAVWGRQAATNVAILYKHWVNGEYDRVGAYINNNTDRYLAYTYDWTHAWSQPSLRADCIAGMEAAVLYCINEDTWYIGSPVMVKSPVRVATTANITLSGLQTIDGVALAAGDRVLVKNQTTATQNGIYLANTTAWGRTADTFVMGSSLSVTNGTLYGGSYMYITNADPIVVDTTAMGWLQTNQQARIYPYGSRQVAFYAPQKQGDGHTRIDMGDGLITCMAGYGESQILRDAFPIFLNYFLAIKDPVRLDEGRFYSNQSQFDVKRNLMPDILSAIVFPQAQLQLNPIWATRATHQAYWMPVGYNTPGSQWGDLEVRTATHIGISQGYFNYSRYEDLAAFLGDGRLLRQNRRHSSFITFSVESAPQEATLRYYYPTNIAESDWAASHFFDRRNGWFMASTLPPTDWGAWTNSVWMITQARPDFGRGEHSMLSDGSLEIGGYGAQLSWGGAGYYKKHPTYCNDFYLVDGIGEQTHTGNPIESVYSQFTHYTNGGPFIFVGGEFSKAYNRSNFQAGSYANNDSLYLYSESTNKRPYLTSLKIFTVFNTNGYLLRYATMTTTQAATFSATWKILEPTANVNTNALSWIYSATNNYDPSLTVTCLVSHVVDPALLGMFHAKNLNPTNNAWPYNSNAFYNPVLNDWTPTNIMDIYSSPMADSTIWVTNRTKATNWHFFQAVGVWKKGSAPFAFTRLDDFTVKVTLPSGGVETNTFNPDYASAFTYNFGDAVGASFTNSPEVGLTSLTFGNGKGKGKRAR